MKSNEHRNLHSVQLTCILRICRRTHSSQMAWQHGNTSGRRPRKHPLRTETISDSLSDNFNSVRVVTLTCDLGGNLTHLVLRIATGRMDTYISRGRTNVLSTCCTSTCRYIHYITKEKQLINELSRTFILSKAYDVPHGPRHNIPTATVRLSPMQEHKPAKNRTTNSNHDASKIPARRVVS